MIPVMNSIMNIGVQGMKAAETRVAIRAVNIVNAATPNYQPFVPVQTTQALAPVVRAERLSIGPGRAPFETLAEDIVDMRLASNAYRASAAIVRTADQMSRTLLDALA
jgi:flagellar hook-associated protein FlgK